MGTHDVLWPDSARWEALVAEFAHRAQHAGFGLVLTPVFEDARRVQPGHRRRERGGAARRCTSSTDRGGRAVALRPEGTASVVRAFVQHHPPVPWKAWYVTPAFRYERPQAGRYRQHHQLGVEVLGHRRPRRRRRGDRPGRRTSTAELGLRRVELARQLHGVRRVPPGVPGGAAGLPRGAPRRAVRRAPRPLRGQPAAGPRLQARPSAGR